MLWLSYSFLRSERTDLEENSFKNFPDYSKYYYLLYFYKPFYHINFLESI